MQDNNLKKDTTKVQEGKENRESPEAKLTERDKRYMVFSKKWRKSGNGNWTILHAPDGTNYKSPTILNDKFKQTYNLVVSEVAAPGQWGSDTKPEYFSEYNGYPLYSIYLAKELAFQLLDPIDDI